MTGKQIKTCEFLNICQTDCNGTLEDTEMCHCYELYKQLARKEQSEERLVKQMQTICDFINNRPEIFKGIYGGVDKIITEYAERKEQECEAFQMSENEAGEIIAELKAENESLKKEIRLYNCIKKWGTKECHCACRCLGNEFCNDAEEKINNLKQTIAEIKEIAKKDIDFCTKCNGDKNIDCVACIEGGRALFGKDVLKKISEVENDR